MPNKTKETGRPICGAKKGSGDKCGLAPGWGTDHPGYGKCVYHGGRSPGGRKAAVMAKVKEEAPAMGIPIDLDPMEALLMCVRIAAGEVAYTTNMIAALETGKAIVNPETKRMYLGFEGQELEDVVISPETLNIWISTRHKCMDNLARYSKMAIDAGISERQIALAERYGQMIAGLLERVLGDLGLTSAQARKAPEIVRTRMLELETGTYG